MGINHLLNGMSTSIEAHTHTHRHTSRSEKRSGSPRFKKKYMPELPNFQTFQKNLRAQNISHHSIESHVFSSLNFDHVFLELLRCIFQKSGSLSRNLSPKVKALTFLKKLRTGDLSLFNLQKPGEPKLGLSWLMADGVSVLNNPSLPNFETYLLYVLFAKQSPFLEWQVMKCHGWRSTLC